MTFNHYVLVSNPMELRSDFDALFFLNHSVMMNSQDGGLVGLGGVGVQNEVATCKPFFHEGLPLYLSHCTRARPSVPQALASSDGVPRLMAMIPHHFPLHFVIHHLPIKGGFVSLHFWPCPKQIFFSSSRTQASKVGKGGRPCSQWLCDCHG